MTDCVYFLLYLALGKLSLMLLINYYICSYLHVLLELRMSQCQHLRFICQYNLTYTLLTIVTSPQMLATNCIM